MRSSRFSDEQIIGMIKEQEAGIPTTEVYRKHGIRTASFYKHKAKYGGMEVSDARKLKALEDENGQLKKLLAEPASNGTTPLPANPCRTALSRVSTAASETNARTKRRPHPCHKHAIKSPNGRRITTEKDHTHHWATSRPTNSLKMPGRK